MRRPGSNNWNQDKPRNRHLPEWRFLPYLLYHIPNKMSNPGECAPLDKSMQPVIIKIAKGTSTSGLTSVYESFKKSLKPSLGRVAVSAFNANRDRQSKDMESQCDRHFESPLYKRIPRSNRLSLCWSLGVHKNRIQSTIFRTKCQIPAKAPLLTNLCNLL